jgi:hypothetical protein
LSLRGAKRWVSFRDRTVPPEMTVGEWIADIAAEKFLTPFGLTA